MSELLDATVKARKHVKEIVDWNFGVVGDDPATNIRLEVMRDFEFKLKTLEPDNYKIYQNEYY